MEVIHQSTGDEIYNKTRKDSVFEGTGRETRIHIAAGANAVRVDLCGNAIFIIIEKICAKTFAAGFCFNGGAILAAGIRIGDDTVQDAILLAAGCGMIGEPFHANLAFSFFYQQASFEFFGITPFVQQG